MTEDEFVNTIYVQAKNEAHLIELLDAAVRERLRVNVGLLKENSDLRKALEMPNPKRGYTKSGNPITDDYVEELSTKAEEGHPLDLHTLGQI